MRRLLGLLAAVVSVACVSSTAPSRYCTTAGIDTIGYGPLMQAKDSIIVACIFVIEAESRCYPTPVKRYRATDCVVGTKWKGDH